MTRYKVPTHIAVPDKMLFGLTARQLLMMLCGAALSYQIYVPVRFLRWDHLGVMGIVLEVAVSLPPFLCACGLAFWQIAERPLEVWVLVALRYRQIPKRYTWCRVKRLRTGYPSIPTPYEEQQLLVAFALGAGSPLPLEVQ